MPPPGFTCKWELRPLTGGSDCRIMEIYIPSVEPDCAVVPGLAFYEHIEYVIVQLLFSAEDAKCILDEHEPTIAPILRSQRKLRFFHVLGTDISAQERGEPWPFLDAPALEVLSLPYVRKLHATGLPAADDAAAWASIPRLVLMDLSSAIDMDAYPYAPAHVQVILVGAPCCLLSARPANVMCATDSQAAFASPPVVVSAATSATNASNATNPGNAGGLSNALPPECRGEAQQALVAYTPLSQHRAFCAANVAAAGGPCIPDCQFLWTVFTALAGKESGICLPMNVFRMIAKAANAYLPNGYYDIMATEEDVACMMRHTRCDVVNEKAGCDVNTMSAFVMGVIATVGKSDCTACPYTPNAAP